MRRPRWRHVLLGLCYAVPFLIATDYIYWHRRGGAFNHH